MPSNPLRNAIKVLREKNWVRGRIAEFTPGTNEVTGLCAVGALRWANGEVLSGSISQEVTDAHTLLSCLATTRLGKPISLSCWNDTVAKDVDEVIELFKLGAERWDEEHVE